jgi:superfamily II DNA or RNA helicase
MTDTSAGEINSDSWKTLPLWQHQKDAIKMVREYQKPGAIGSALVRMPTGSGKSGIIAVLARCFEDTPNVLIVAPWLDLCGQLERDIRERFWKIIGVNPNPWMKNIRDCLA